MVNQAKVYEVENITEKIKSAKAAALIDYQGLDAGQTSQLRQKIKESGGSMQVVKNTLLTLALNNIGVKLEEELQGPTALVLAEENQIAPLKAISQIAEEFEKPKFKFGILDNEFLSSEKIEKLVNLPSKEVLLSMLVNGLHAPMVNLVNALQFNQRKLVLVLKAVSQEKGGEA